MSEDISDVRDIGLGPCWRPWCDGVRRPSIYEARWVDGERCGSCGATWYFVAPISISEFLASTARTPERPPAVTDPDGTHSRIKGES